uniref:Cytochrome c oxidase subunit 2 n=1 Tax=Phoronopsis harmeri TaxID=490051 RepID=J9PNC2_9BILA|nr:cytochrome c oxidase subunit II [Phoronopsis harmeri]AES86297.1 cytochrome c oxidase subunit II [Phoronopsis harmeri]
MASWGQLGFQDGASPLMEQLIFFYDHAMFVLVMITILVFYVGVYLLNNKYTSRYLLEGQQIEIIWTILPAIILVFLALPSLRLLYLLDEVNDPVLSLKVVGRQWYWSYEYSDFIDLSFDSYMIPEEDLTPGMFRLLEVDHRTVIPYGVSVRTLITASDVIHSWTVPSLGVKADAIPGRLNQLSFLINHPGVFYGQCSEICGANHSFMPIVVEATNISSFINWVNHNVE